jgi:hypothetical protein
MRSLALLMLLSLGACSPADSSQGCVPGHSAACACPNGRSGAQVCRSDRTYDGCVCTSSGAQGCVPGQSTACACTDGRMGAQVCQGDRTYGPCVCTGGPGVDIAGPGDADLRADPAVDLRP